jgi:photosystem II stability/assembly factor-like uncharacterized protein
LEGNLIRTQRFIVAAFLVFIASSASLHGQQQTPQPVDPNLYSAMRWRLIGPYRAGRVSAVAGIPGDPAVYYMGTPGGGVWKTSSAGRVWKPIFDDQHVASIGAVAIAPSDPNIVYVGTGEQTDGNGMYKSTDAGATWTRIGLADVRYINSIIVDPRDPQILVVGALGHPILGVAAASPWRGIFKSTDGGKSWTKTLYRDDFAGAADTVADPNNPRVLFTALWKPFDFFSGPPDVRKPDSWIYKSEDQGATWKELPITGFPTDEPLGRIGLAVAPGTHGQRVFAITEPGLFRSDDGGQTWHKITNDSRVLGNLYFSRVFVDPNNADIVYVMQTTTYRSTDGGKTFTAYKGAPGGDDYHVLWIDPKNSQRMILGVDQGATISVDGGKTWSTWFNQPTGQFYHVITDNQFPYYSYAPQQDSGTVVVPNRSDYGEISFRDWFSTGGFEFCYIAPDPQNPNIIYSGGWYGSVVRFDKTTGQITHVFVRTGNFRTTQMPPLVFSPEDPKTLYLATQFVLKTRDEGNSWQTISPDLTVPPGTPANGEKSPTGASGHTPESDLSTGTEKDTGELNAYGAAADSDEKEFEVQRPGRRAAIMAMVPSPLQATVIWAGTSNGLVQVTQDGSATWHNVTPAGLPPQSVIMAMEASHYDAATAYIVTQAAKDKAPYIYRTHDAGKSWQQITNGLEHNWLARVVREDPVRKGLLYAGTENALYVSFDDGDHWQSLQLNFPASDVRDLGVHGDDLVAATYGRAIWILDDLSPLRQASVEIYSANAYLLKPANTIRARWDNDQETPLPPETPAGKNPPDGAIFDYYLKSAPTGVLTLEIHDAQGKFVRRFTSIAAQPDTTPKNVPDYWFGPMPALSKNVGHNRFVWDLRYDSPKTLPFSYYGNILDYVEYTLSDHAIPEDTPREQTLGPIAVPGQYEAILIANGVLMKQPFTITLDPRVHVSQVDLVKQLDALNRIGAGLESSYQAYLTIVPIREAITARQKSLEDFIKQHRPAEKQNPPGKSSTGEAPSAATQPPNSSDAATQSPHAKDAAAEPKENAEAKESAAKPVQVAEGQDLADALKDLDKKIALAQEGTFTAPGIGPAHRDLARLSFMIESGDAAPSQTAAAALDESCTSLNKNIVAWRDIAAQGFAPINTLLAKYNLAPLPAPQSPPATQDACRAQ